MALSASSRLLFVKVLAAVCTRRSCDPWLTEVVGNPLLCVVLMACLKNPMVLSYHLCNWLEKILLEKTVQKHSKEKKKTKT